MIVQDKDKTPIYFDNYGLSTPEISKLISSINLAINNYRKYYNITTKNNDYSKMSTVGIFNMWLYNNPQWNGMDFQFLIDVFDYIETMKDETGIMLS